MFVDFFAVDFCFRFFVTFGFVIRFVVVFGFVVGGFGVVVGFDGRGVC